MFRRQPSIGVRKTEVVILKTWVDTTGKCHRIFRGVTSRNKFVVNKLLIFRVVVVNSVRTSVPVRSKNFLPGSKNTWVFPIRLYDPGEK